MRMRAAWIFALAFVLVASAAFGEKIAWRETIEKALEEAKTADKPVLVEAFAVG